MSPSTDDLFYADYPLWTIVLPAAVWDFGIAFGVYLPNRGDGAGAVLLVFTDNDIAATYLESVRDGEHFAMHPIESAVELRELCEAAKSRGCRYVTVDFTKQRTYQRYWTIEEFERAIHSPGI